MGGGCYYVWLLDVGDFLDVIVNVVVVLDKLNGVYDFVGLEMIEYKEFICKVVCF